MIGFLGWILMMCANDRFLKQINIINSNSNIDILGGNILCFETFPNFSQLELSLLHIKNIRFMKYRNPVNPPTVFFNRNRIIGIGGYPNARLGQDYLLWINAVISGLTIKNMKDILVYMKGIKIPIQEEVI